MSTPKTNQPKPDKDATEKIREDQRRRDADLRRNPLLPTEPAMPGHDPVIGPPAGPVVKS